jgi:hypothetical protein
MPLVDNSSIAGFTAKRFVKQLMVGWAAVKFWVHRVSLH